MSFDDAIAVQHIGERRYSCNISRDYWIVAGPNGGYIAALLVHAIELEIDDPARQLAGTTIHYLRRPKEGPAEVVVAEPLHKGRTASFRRADLVQDGTVIATATGSWIIEMAGVDIDRWEMPSAPPPDECTPMAEIRTTDPLPFHEQWDIRSVGGVPFGAGDATDLLWWIRPRPHRGVDGPLMVQVADAMPPPLFMVAMPEGGVPTIDLTVHVRTRLDQIDWNTGDWFLVRFHSRLAGNGLVEEDGEIWTADGTLVAHSRQLALAR